ncbi:MAG: hypothetical protein ABR596_00095 [Halarsenatibacteraceae bacterium]
MTKKLAQNLIITFIIITAIFLLAGKIQAEVNNSEQLNDLINSIYSNYQAGEFQEVYQLLHPGITENLTEEEYVNFQQDNKEKYQLEISEIEIIEIQAIDELPSKFDKYLTEEDYQNAYQAKVKYQMDFKFLKTNQHKEVDTETYLVESDGQLYLVWDRSVIEEDDPGAGIE